MVGDDEEEDCADVCYKCNQWDREDELLVCDTCNYNVCHYDCDGLKSLPKEEDEWSCEKCTMRDKRYAIEY